MKDIHSEQVCGSIGTTGALSLHHGHMLLSHVMTDGTHVSSRNIRQMSTCSHATCKLEHSS